MTQSQPILMSGAMVRAILQGRKSQTRRIIKPQPPAESVSVSETLMSRDNPAEEGAWEWWAGGPQQVIYGPVHLRYRRGQLLWVRERFGVNERAAVGSYGYVPPELPTYPPHAVIAGIRRSIHYHADAAGKAWGMYGPPKWRPSIHMPRTASRLTLEVTAVKVERLQDIAPDDCIAEGAWPAADRTLGRGHEAVAAFQSLWTSINGPGSWEANPWIVAVSFTPHLKNIDQLETRKDAQR